jgi:hypothetical protein
LTSSWLKTMIDGQLDTAQSRFAAVWHGPDVGHTA